MYKGAPGYLKPYFRGIDRNKDGLMDETEWKGVVAWWLRFQVTTESEGQVMKTRAVYERAEIVT